MRRVVLCTSDPVGARMAGLGIRYHRLAGELARRFDVTLVAPGDGPAEEVPYTFRRASAGLPRDVEADVVVAQSVPYLTARSLRARGTRIVVDLYVPSLVEAAAQLAAEDGDSTRLPRYDETRRAQLAALAVGDAFICASERQRDFWLGALGATGRIRPELYRADPTLRSLVDVVPVGLDPVAAGPSGAVKGRLAGVAPADRVLLWGGGIWNWYDPLTVIRAAGLVAERRPDVRLVFMGTRHPSAAVDEMAMAGRAVALARSLGLEGTHVVFNEGWIPYADRVAWFRDADLGVSAHLDTAEARFSFRTRLLDHLACGTPLVVTRGDLFAQLVEEHGLGRAVDPGDAEAFAAAVLELLDDDAARARARVAVEREREALAWPEVASRLAAIVDSTVRLPAGGGAAASAAAKASALRASLARRGIAGTLSALARNLADARRR